MSKSKMESSSSEPAERIKSRAARLAAKKSGATAKGPAVGSDGLSLGAAAASAGGSLSKAPVKALARVADGLSALDAKKVRRGLALRFSH